MIVDDLEKSIIDYSRLESLRGKTILVTGGTGFIGSWMVAIISFLNDSFNFQIKLFLVSRNLEPDFVKIHGNSGYIHIQSDIRHLKQIPENIDYIINAAGSPDSRYHISNSLKNVETFLKGSSSFYEVVSRSPNVKKIIHLSSSQVYGENSNPIKLSEDNSNSSQLNFSEDSAYAEVKRFSETLCKLYIKEYSLPIVIIRPFAFIGPFQKLDKPWAINNFIRDAILGGPIKILGNPNVQRSYLYGSDLAYFLLCILIDGDVGETYNIGSDEAISLIDLAEKVANLYNSNLEIIVKSSKDEYLTNSYIVPNLEKIETKLNLKVQIGIEYALNSTLLWNKLKSNN